MSEENLEPAAWVDLEANRPLPDRSNQIANAPIDTGWEPLVRLSDVVDRLQKISNEHIHYAFDNSEREADICSILFSSLLSRRFSAHLQLRTGDSGEL